MPAADLGELLGSLDVSVSEEGFAQTAASLMEGYAEYVKEHPEGDMTGLAQSFQDYIRTDGQEILKTHIAEIIRDAGGMTVTSKQISELTQKLKDGYLAYAAGKQYASAEELLYWI